MQRREIVLCTVQQVQFSLPALFFHTIGTVCVPVTLGYRHLIGQFNWWPSSCVRKQLFMVSNIDSGLINSMYVEEQTFSFYCIVSVLSHLVAAPALWLLLDGVVWINPMKWTYFRSCPQQWVSFHYIILKISSFDGLYSVLRYVDIM